MIIAIDGPAAAGKGTLARRLADHLGYAYLDTGALYRVVAVMVLRQNGDPGDAGISAEAARTLDLDLLESADLRTAEAGVAASKVAAIPSVRAALVNFQRQFAITPPGNAGGAILDGRDIGTVICPDADHKLFVTASLEARADRRFKELQERDEAAIYSDVLQDMSDRDARDANRKDAPMTQAENAILIDTSLMTQDEVFVAALEVIEGTGKSR